MQTRLAPMRRRAAQRQSSQFGEGHACGGLHSLVVGIDEHGGGGMNMFAQSNRGWKQELIYAGMQVGTQLCFLGQLVPLN
ncbi:hypothetical protein SORBI_3002G280001 [Sorghum bicolor]|uniref:Uncharacterized protein n=1 Tax=Sorghum bicolor TaxID=4558 RepID=A0A1W0W607_SORBI|nr:hypothetical protein SORBI_3002G280001 [Sorghum bicolor]